MMVCYQSQTCLKEDIVYLFAVSILELYIMNISFIQPPTNCRLSSSLCTHTRHPVCRLGWMDQTEIKKLVTAVKYNPLKHKWIISELLQ